MRRIFSASVGGFTSLEAIIGIFTFAILSIGVISLAVVGTRLALDSERRVVALALVNERIEFIRSLPYEQVALAPAGAIVQQEDVTRNQQTYGLETLIEVIDPPAGLKKKIQVTANWLVPAGGTRDVQVVTYVAASSPGSSEQIACTPPNFTEVIKSVAAYSEARFVDDAFVNCKAACDQTSLPPWQCCGWQVAYRVRNLQDANSPVDIECTCTPPAPLEGEATDHPSLGQYTDFAKACLDGRTCGTGVVGTPRCNASCLQGPGDCICECP